MSKAGQGGRPKMAATTRAGEAGFTYVASIFLLAILAAGSARAMLIWKTAERREREADLLYVGSQYQQAIQQYFEQTPGTIKKYPVALADLLLDKRATQTCRPLRRLFRDPIANSADWGLVAAPDGGIMGVYSKSVAEPIKTGGFLPEQASFAHAAHYSDWQFVYVPPA